MNDWRALLHQFATGQISRRAFMAAAVATGASAGAIGKALAADVCGPCQAVEAAAQAQASPTAGGPLLPSDWVGPRINNPGPLTEEKKTLKICVPQHVEVGDWESNTFTQWYEARTNVHIEWQVVNGTEDERRAAVNAIIAGGDLPDIFMSAPFSPAQVQLFGQQGIFQPLNDIIDQNCTELLGVFSTFPLYRDLVSTTDGNIYAMPNINDCYHCKGSSKLWMNKAWLDKLGLGIPQTTEEFRTALQAFKAQDPNGNGQADEIGLMSATDSWVGVTSVTGGVTNGSFDNFFMGSFMYNPGQPWLVLNDSKVDVTFNKDGWREGLKYLNSLVNDGTLAPESFSQLSEQLLRIGDNEGAEILGAAPGGYWGVFLTIDQTQAGARWEDYVAIPPLAGPDGTRIAGWNHYGGAEIAMVTITSACDDPVLAAKWVDGLYELEATCRAYAGELGTDWRWAEEGELGINGKQGVWKQLVTWSSDAMRGHWWGQQNPNYRSSDFRLGEVVDPDAPTFESPLYQTTLENYFPYAEDQSQQMPLLYLTDEQATVVGEFAATVTGYVMQSMAEFITGAKDPNDDGAWSDYTSTLDSMGVANYLATYQQAYDAKYGGA